ncbi:sigma-70 family RNA polymerase sigma factor [Listeria monocytogenes]|nr:sigma-70 family RNA polymerase sigma factor [Listeria monocytogenes]
MLNTSSHQKIVEQQFDSFCKKVLRNQARNIYAENKRWKEKFISLEALTSAELSQLSIHDNYEAECVYFSINDYDIPIEDVLVAQAIESLSKRQQDIILLSFFLDMKDVDIAELMSLAKSTVHYHKENALNELRKFMEEHVDEK